MISEELWDAVLPLLRRESKTGHEATLGKCIQQAKAHGVRADLVILVARCELPLAKHDRSGLFPHLVVNVATSHGGGIYRDDTEALNALNLVAQALDQTLTVQVIE